MKVSIIQQGGANSKRVRIITESRDLSVLVSSDVDTATALKVESQKLREHAFRLLRQAGLIESAADQVN